MARLGICLRNVDDVLRALHVDVDNDDVDEIQFTNNLNEMRRLVGKDVIMLKKARVGGCPVRVICDGSNEPQGKVSAIDPSCRPVLHGSLIVVGSHMEGKDEILNSLSDTAMMTVKDHVALLDIGSGSAKYNTYALCDVEVE